MEWVYSYNPGAHVGLAVSKEDKLPYFVVALK